MKNKVVVITGASRGIGKSAAIVTAGRNSRELLDIDSQLKLRDENLDAGMR